MVVETLERRMAPKEISRVFKALGDENRMAIFQYLRSCCCTGCDVTEESARRTVSEIADQFDLALSTVSHHLKELRNAELIVCDKHGKNVFCRINTRLLDQLAQFMRE
jgi:DNA-binding transcriptional ArsR family regulator